MKKKLASLAPFALALAVVASPAFAETRRPLEFASDSQTLPVVANNPGLANATFSTLVAIMNPTSSSFDVHMTLHDSAGVATTKTVTLAAHELKTYPNFLDAVWSQSGAGSVTLEADPSAGGTHNHRFIVSAEVYTTTPGSRFGTTVPALEFAGTDSRSFSAGISADVNWRTNVGCFNQTGSPNVVKATTFDATGAQIGTVNLNLAANAWGQIAVSGTVSNGYVQFDPGGAAVCYAVVVNNITNDGRFISAVEYTP